MFGPLLLLGCCGQSGMHACEMQHIARNHVKHF